MASKRSGLIAFAIGLGLATIGTWMFGVADRGPEPVPPRGVDGGNDGSGMQGRAAVRPSERGSGPGQGKAPSVARETRRVVDMAEKAAGLVDVVLLVKGKRFQPLDDVNIEVTIGNASSEDLEFPDVENSISWEFVGAEVSYENYWKDYYAPGYYEGAIETCILAPGEEMHVSIRLQGAVDLNRPGRYTVRACFDPEREWGSSPHTVWSNAVEFIVEPPTEERYRRLLALVDAEAPWSDMDYHMIEALGDIGDARAVPLLETIVARARREKEWNSTVFGYAAYRQALLSLDKIEVAGMLRANDRRGLEEFVKRRTRGYPRRTSFTEQVRKIIAARWGSDGR